MTFFCTFYNLFFFKFLYFQLFLMVILVTVIQYFFILLYITFKSCSAVIINIYFFMYSSTFAMILHYNKCHVNILYYKTNKCCECHHAKKFMVLRVGFVFCVYNLLSMLCNFLFSFLLIL